MKARCYDRDFRYTPASATDIRKTFARERKRLAADQAAAEAQKSAKVQMIRRTK